MRSRADCVARFRPATGDLAIRSVAVTRPVLHVRQTATAIELGAVRLLTPPPTNLVLLLVLPLPLLLMLPLLLLVVGLPLLLVLLLLLQPQLLLQPRLLLLPLLVVQHLVRLHIYLLHLCSLLLYQYIH